MADDIEFEEEEFTTQFNGQTIKRILLQTKPHWKWVLGFLIAVAVVVVLDAYFTYTRGLFIDEGIVPGDGAALLRLGSLYAVMIVFQAAGVFGFIYLAGILGERIQYDLRKKMFDRLQDLSLTYYSQTPVGWIMSRVTSDSVRISELVTWGIVDSVWGFLSIVTSFAVMITINWQLALDGAAVDSGAAGDGGVLQAEDHFGIPQCAPHQQQDHGRVQREHHGRARDQGAGPRGRKPARVRHADQRYVSRRVSRRVAVGLVFARRADHQRGRHRHHHLVWRVASGNRRAEGRAVAGLHLVHHVHDVARFKIWRASMPICSTRLPVPSASSR